MPEIFRGPYEPDPPSPPFWVMAIVIVLAGGLVAFAGFYLKWGTPGSDYQRLNALEIRVEALEESR